MSTGTWPSSLPRPSRNSWQAQQDDGRMRRSGGGPPGYRRRFSSTARMVSLSINVPRSQKAVFDNFYMDTTSAGSTPFWMPDPTTDGWALLDAAGRPVNDATGQPILLSARWLCLFGDETPIETIQGVRFDISFSVAVMP